MSDSCWLDLRSDTVTRPSAEMRKVMYEAEVGDDVYGEDPTVNALQEQAAALLGKEAALFVASGTQSNLIALLTHCTRGDEYIAGYDAHTYKYEGGGAAALGGIQPCPIPFAADGSLDLAAVEDAVKPDDPHFARTRLLCLENTQSGRPLGSTYMQAAGALAARLGLRMHVDGARLLNAAVALDTPAATLVDSADSVSMCLSKGLGAPVGSILAGSTPFISEARRLRKMVGGGMRQAGVIAAAGLYALRNHVSGLSADHRRAATVAECLQVHFPNQTEVHTNMVFLHLPEPQYILLREHLHRCNIRVNRPRWVFHRDLDDAGIERLVTAIARFADTQR